MKQETLRPGQEIVSGIDKITETIEAKAQEEVTAIFTQAEAEASAILADCEEKAQAILSAAQVKAKKESAVANERALSASANHKRNQLLFQKGELVEEAFANALKALESLGEEAYFKLLHSLLVKALEDYFATEARSAEYEGKDFVKETSLFLVMAKRDQAYGKALAEAVSERVAAKGKTLSLAEADAAIGSGFVLTAGDIRMDSSLKTLIASQKASLEGEVYRILFA